VGLGLGLVVHWPDCLAAQVVLVLQRQEQVLQPAQPALAQREQLRQLEAVWVVFLAAWLRAR
jgi:hypothetical protein